MQIPSAIPFTVTIRAASGSDEISNRLFIFNGSIIADVRFFADPIHQFYQAVGQIP
jgi:hypothetical protein